MSWSPAPIEIAKYTDAELMEKAEALSENIHECEAFERWKPSLVEELSWVRWELDRRDKEAQP